MFLLTFSGIVILVSGFSDFFELFGFDHFIFGFAHSHQTIDRFTIVQTTMTLFFILLGIIIVASAIGEMLRIYGFEIENSPKALLIKRGLLTETLSSVQKDRIYGLGVDQTILQRIFGFATLKIYVMGDAFKGDRQNDTEVGELILHPCIELAGINTFLNVVLPEYGKAYQIEPHLYLTKRGEYRIIRKTIYIYATVLVLAYILSSYLPAWIDNIIALVILNTLIMMAVLIFGICVTLSTMWELRRDSYALSRDFLVKRKVRLETSTDYFPRRSLEFAQYKQTLFQLKPQLCDFISETVAVSDIKIEEMTMEEAHEILHWVETGELSREQ